jgi:hypothetical protein
VTIRRYLLIHNNNIIDQTDLKKKDDDRAKHIFMFENGWKDSFESGQLRMVSYMAEAEDLRSKCN